MGGSPCRDGRYSILSVFSSDCRRIPSIYSPDVYIFLVICSFGLFHFLSTSVHVTVKPRMHNAIKCAEHISSKSLKDFGINPRKAASVTLSMMNNQELEDFILLLVADLKVFQRLVRERGGISSAAQFPEPGDSPSNARNENTNTALAIHPESTATTQHASPPQSNLEQPSHSAEGCRARIGSRNRSINYVGNAIVVSSILPQDVQVGKNVAATGAIDLL